MFSGIIETTGAVSSFSGTQLWIRVPFRGMRLGDSLAVEGVCLTVARKKGRDCLFDVGPVTARITTLGQLKTGSRVNLERSLRVGDRLGGHWVTGHVEQMGRVLSVKRDRNSWTYRIGVPRLLTRYIVPKGSIAIDGISLTIVSVRKTIIEFMIIPHTFSNTTLGGKKAGDRVNLEADILAKYTEKIMTGTR